MELIVIDIGGTAIKYGVLDEHENLLFRESIPSEAHLGGNELIKKVLRICDQVKRKWDVFGVAISSAGQIDSEHGVVVHATETIPGYTGMSVTEMVTEHTGLPATIENDVNCTAIGEHWKGAAVGVDDFVCMTFGTGIGGALFMNGQLHAGANFSAGEFGHINLYKDGKLCTCGNYGCYERYASSAALSEIVASEFGRSIQLPVFFQMVKQGDALSVEIFNKWIDDVATGIQSIVHIFNPKLVVIGGGITAQGDFLLHAMQSAVDEKLMPNHRNQLNLKLALNDNNANLLGAAKHYFTKQ
ncbi:ROK family protein [Lentibacillus sp. Marseille-P4043]|uniref:ROK family protein n=1 Tax=Lentibacillus sp. Marseille-P4043 TaxID=2040293 RepID=UPI000D0AE103|nr:ROK family protein [Lentibacillus sp. Marseille-P4043]